jgi:hypothetical protein
MYKAPVIFFNQILLYVWLALLNIYPNPSLVELDYADATHGSIWPYILLYAPYSENQDLWQTK